MAEIVYEKMAFALESTAGTPISAPTHIMPGTAMLSAGKDVNRPDETRGTRAEFYRAKTMRKWEEWDSGDTGLDTYMLPPLLNAACAPVTSPSTPGGATLSRLWSFVRSQTASTEKTLTMWWGDPNIQIFRGAYGVVDGFSIKADGTGTDAAMMAFNGRTQAKSKVSTPTYPTQLVGPMVSPLDSQLWIDTSSAFGTTAITGRVISSEFKVDNLRGDPKFLWSGPGSSRTYNRFGAKKTHAELTLRFELFDMTQYDLIEADTPMKIRVRHNGDLIETGFYHYVEYDIYGVADAPKWGEAFGSNRTFDITVISQYEPNAGYDWAVRVQNDRTSL